MEMPLLIAIFVCVTTGLFVIGLISSLNSRKKRREWLSRAEGSGNKDRSEEATQSYSPAQKSIFQVLRVLGEANKPRNEEELSHVRRTLSKAGYRSREAALIFFGAKLCLAIVLPLGFAVLRTFALKTLLYSHAMFFFVLLALIGFYMPNAWLQMKTQQRQRKIFESFPDAMDLMVVCVEAGLGLDAAIRRVGDEIALDNRELSQEFELLSLELRAGQTRQTALRNLSLRTDLEDVQSLVTLLIQSDRFGTSVAQALRVYSDAMRTKRRQRAEELAAKLPIKLLFPLIFFIFPALFVVIMGPAVIQMIRIVLPTLGGQ